MRLDSRLQKSRHGIYFLHLSATALTVDETLDEVFGKISSDTDLNRIGIRVMVHLLHNAFAHNPWRPKWVVYQKYRNTYPIQLDDGSKFNFESSALDGDGVQPEQVGRLEFWVKLLQHCKRQVSEYTVTSHE